MLPVVDKLSAPTRVLAAPAAMAPAPVLKFPAIRPCGSWAAAVRSQLPAAVQEAEHKRWQLDGYIAVKLPAVAVAAAEAEAGII